MDKLKQICKWITSVLITVMAVLLIVSCISIYQSGSRPFTREVIEEFAGNLAIPGILCLCAVMIGLLIPNSADKWKAVRDQKLLLKRYSANISEALQEQKKRRQYRTVFWTVTGVLAIYPVIYLADSAHFQVADVNGDVLRAAIVVLIPAAIVMALNLFLQHLEQASISREIEIYRSHDMKPGKAPESRGANTKRIAIIRAVILIAGIAMVTVGALNGGAADVLGKAIRICTECIGLG